MPLENQKKDKTIFRYLLGPLLLLLFLALFLWKGSLLVSGVLEQLDQNARDLLGQKVVNRAGYLQNEMLHHWSELESLSDQINKRAQELYERGVIDFKTLDESSENAAPLLLDILHDMISAMRTAQATGIYVIFNNENLDEGLEDKTGVYLRDMDPLSQSSMVNGDLLFERAPIEVVEKSDISTDSMWRPRFEFGKRQTPYYDFFYVPYQAGLFNEAGYSPTELGYWGRAEELAETGVPAITYSMPLINQEGMVYGVVGVDITLSYLNKLLPPGELSEQGSPSSYLLGVMEGEELCLEPVFSRGNAYRPENEMVSLTENGDGYWILDGEERYYAAAEYLDLYVSNTPYSQQRWVLAGIMKEGDLYAVRGSLLNTIRIALIVLFFLGFSICLWASYIIARPIRALSDQVESSVPGQELALKRTHIVEIDKLAQRMEKLDRNIRNTALKFTNILKMSSVGVAGFECNVETGELFLSDNFFEIFQDFTFDPQGITMDGFLKKMREYDSCLIAEEKKEREYLYAVPDETGRMVYVRLRFLVRGGVYTGVAENVTGSVQEKRRIEYERDHDALTGLLNRRAFQREAAGLLERNRETPGKAGLLMIDLDNLKYVNDTYGHEYGDRYIQKAAEILNGFSSERTLSARISGDEFNLFFCGYETEEEVRALLCQLEEQLERASISLPEGQEYPVRASGGFAWLCRKEIPLWQLQKYADDAMYQVKRTEKGKIKFYEDTQGGET